jgi:hypothetical protein
MDTEKMNLLSFTVEKMKLMDGVSALVTGHIVDSFIDRRDSLSPAVEYLYGRGVINENTFLNWAIGVKSISSLEKIPSMDWETLADDLARWDFPNMKMSIPFYEAVLERCLCVRIQWMSPFIHAQYNPGLDWFVARFPFARVFFWVSRYVKMDTDLYSLSHVWSKVDLKNHLAALSCLAQTLRLWKKMASTHGSNWIEEQDWSWLESTRKQCDTNSKDVDHL